MVQLYQCNPKCVYLQKQSKIWWLSRLKAMEELILLIKCNLDNGKN